MGAFGLQVDYAVSRLGLRASVCLTFCLLVAGAGCTSTTKSRGAPEVAALTAESAQTEDAAPAVAANPYQVAGKWYQPEHDPNYDREGVASWYGPRFHGRRTANGEVFDRTGLTAAHPTLPLPSYVRVTNTANDRSIVVRVNDRGPFSRSRLIDVSERTADLLGFKGAGMAPVRVQYVGRAEAGSNDEGFLLASFRGPDGAVGSPKVILAAASEPVRSARKRIPPKQPIQVAALKGPPADEPNRPIAFAVQERSEVDVAANEAVGALSQRQQTADRIAMTFDLISAPQE